ncbi:hypothetical protein RF11_16182 [Thelohanellus kitauei]|uniref:Ubiquitin-like domain-containing protein n=1 Tax=Thelohanellus kitauei TaxID=669202 RepID=A0A0C2NKQ6_THEKT|nr:hypothetical protein RF11_16182 [Thelohanellus kitauei]
MATFLVIVHSNVTKYEPFLLSTPENTKVCDLKLKIANIIGLEQFRSELVFSGVLTNKNDESPLETAYKSSQTISKSSEIYPINVSVPAKRMKLVKLPHELMIKNIDNIKSFCSDTENMNMTLPPNLLHSFHRQAVNFLAASLICDRETERSMRAKWPVDYFLHGFLTPFVENNQNHQMRNICAFALKLLIFYLLILMVFIFQMPYTIPRVVFHWVSVLGALIGLISVLFWSFVVEYIQVMKFYFRNNQNHARNAQVNEGPIIDVRHIVNVCCEFLFTLLPNIRI